MPALFGILQLDRGEPLGLQWDNVSGLVQTWLQDAGGFAALGLAIYLGYALARPAAASESQKLRLPLTGWMVAMAALALVFYAVVAATVLVEWTRGTRVVSVGGLTVALAPPPPPQAPPGSPVKLPPPTFYKDVRSLALMTAGLLAILGIGQPFVRDLWKVRFRRVWALAKVGFKEAVRSRLLWVFLVMLLPFLFPLKWFTPGMKPEDELRTTMWFVSLVMMFLVLFPALLLSSFSIPNDIKNLTIHTVVTKPVERFEIVLGRFLGYTFLMTLVLVALAGFSVALVAASNIDEKAREETFKARLPLRGQLLFASRKADFQGTNVGREFEYRKYITGHPLSPQRGVWLFDHVPSAVQTPADDRVPVEFTFDIFKLTKGDDEYRGVNVSLRFATWQCGQRPPTQEEGGEWQWADNTPDASGLTAKQRYEADVRQLRQEGVNPETVRPGTPGWEKVSALAAKYGFFEIRGKEVADYHVMGVDVPAGFFRNAAEGDPTATTPDGKTVPAPRFYVFVKCESPGQMLGMAQPDLYVLEREGEGAGWFALNYLKSVFGLWCRLCIVIGIAVACSTYLTGVITLMAAGFVFLSGYATDHITDLALSRSIGGGPAESFNRMIKAQIPTTPLDGSGAGVIQGLDAGFGWLFRRFQNVVPDVESFSWTHFVSEGFNVNTEFLAVNLLVMVGYLLPWFVLAYYLMKSREIAS